jgi:hypothetical protein
MISDISVTPRLIGGIVLAVVFVCLNLFGIYVQWHMRQIYKRIGNYSIETNTFNWQLARPGLNFPGPNVLEAHLAAQPADLQAYVSIVRRRIRYLRWATLSFIGVLFSLGLGSIIVHKWNL